MEIDVIKQKIEELEKSRIEKTILRETIEFIINSIEFFDWKKVLEIGTFEGYSALWFAIVANEVVTIEVVTEAFDKAVQNLECAANVQPLLGNAFDVIAQLKNEGRRFNVVLIDGKKSEYADYLEAVLDILEDDFLIFVDNTISHKDSLGGFLEHLKRYENLEWKEINIGKGLIVIKKKIIQNEIQENN